MKSISTKGFMSLGSKQTEAILSTAPNTTSSRKIVP